MTKETFFALLTEEVSTYKGCLETVSHDWIVKGFIDIDKNVYTITNDTKIVSKIIEILLIPRLDRFAQKNGLTLELPSKQNFYPDLTFKDSEGHLFAVDIKSSYYENNRVQGLTLGSYWGYFRERDITKHMDYTYSAYSSHTILGMLYKQSVAEGCPYQLHSIGELAAIHSVIEEFIFFVQPKWKIANDVPGSGNTRNIGGITDINKLLQGEGPFAPFGEEVFDDYWQGYYNKADAKAAGLGVPKYNNLETYRQYLSAQAGKLQKLQRQ